MLLWAVNDDLDAVGVHYGSGQWKASLYRTNSPAGSISSSPPWGCP
jgi:hypothetical protein